jgi:predicted Ser/Thr protein kinase
VGTNVRRPEEVLVGDVAGARGTPLQPDDPVRLGQYEMLARLGQGGMGAVYLARSRHGVLVAVKVVRPDLASDDEFRRRFRSEVNRVRQVPPFCTAEVLDADPDHAFPYLVVEYVDGPSLAEVVQSNGPLSAANLHALAIGVATALTAIHGAGVVHRDLKPRNVLLAPGGPKVIDFGIARAMEATSRLTRTNQMLGTVAYMAPERFDSDSPMPLGPSADVFAWGAVITYAGTGRTPFHADSPPATAARILTQPPDLRGLAPQLRDVVERSLAKDPDDRPTARELLNLLLGGAGVAPAGRVELAQAARHARPAVWRAGRLEPVVRRRFGVGWRSAAAAAAPVVALTVGVTLAVRGRSSGPNPAAGGQPSASAPAGGVRDDLAAVGLWRETSIEQGSCLFLNARLVARLSVTGHLLCSGPPADIAGEQVIAVDIALNSTSGCALIDFDVQDSDFYELRDCADTVELYRNKERRGDLTRIGGLPVAAPAPTGRSTRVTLRVTRLTVQVSHDDRVIGELPLDPALVHTGGGFDIGVFGKPGTDPPYEVAFGRFEARPSA